MLAKDIPTDINEIDDTILTKAIICEETGRPFRIIKPELEFYRKMNIPIPHKHPDQRHKERMNMKPPKELFLRTCDQCGVETISVYDQNYVGKVYCEACYNKEMYS